MDGDAVSLAVCDESLKACECNKDHLLAHCARCMGIRSMGVSLLSKKVSLAKLFPSADFAGAAKRLVMAVRGINDLKRITIGHFDLGMAVYSSLVDHTKCTEPNVKLWRERLIQLTADALASYSFAKCWMTATKADMIYIFNGRYAAARAFVRAAQETGTPFCTHERTSSLGRIRLFSDSVPHDPRPYRDMVKRFWAQHGLDPKVVEQGIDFFEERPRRKLTGWVSMIEGQSQGRLPDSWDPSKRNIAIFGSTEGEFVALQDLYEGALFTSQLEAYSRLLQHASIHCPDLTFYLRLHPNSRNELNRWWKHPSLANIPNLEVIEPDDEVSSYALLNACEKIVGIGSSMCLEATYWGKPSLLLGLTFFSGLDAVYECASIEAACRMLHSRDLPPKEQINAIKFGAFMRCGGEVLPHSEPVNYYTLKFKGKVLEARQEIHEWLGACENRSPAQGIRARIRNKQDRHNFRLLWDKFNGCFQ